MAKSTGIVLAAGAVAFTNEWFHTDTPNFRIVLGTVGSALFLSAVEQLNQQAGVGLAVIFAITVMLTPIDGDAPTQTITKLLNNEDPRDTTKKKGKK